MRTPLALALVAPLALASGADAPRLDTNEAITNIAFGSCFDPTRGPVDVWDAVNDAQPDLFLFVGDNVYADTDDPEEYVRNFDGLDAVEGYAKLRERTPVLAVWDDHDYGFNDDGAEFPAKEQNQRLFLDAFDVPADSPRRARPGIYDSVTVGPEGERLQIILLDTRYFRSPIPRDRSLRREDWVEGRPGSYRPNTDPSSTILGEAQWRWLEGELREPADARLIVTSYQFVANDHRFEKWGNFPHERERMLELIDETGAEGVFFVSGDRHRAELSRLDETPMGYPIYDLTSSAMNRSSGRYWNEINEHRVGALYDENNFGVVGIDWDAREIRFEIRHAGGDVKIRHRVALDELTRD
jgi:alkaline phosphatase D